MGLYGEPVSPQSRVFLRQEMDFSIDSFVCFENPIDVITLKAALSSSLIRNCPKLRSIVVGMLAVFFNIVDVKNLTGDRRRFKYILLPT